MKKLKSLINQFLAKQYQNCLAQEIYPQIRFSDCLLYHSPTIKNHPNLFSILDHHNKYQIDSLQSVCKIEDNLNTVLILDGTLNYSNNIDEIFSIIYKNSSRNFRLLIVCYNSYLWPFYRLANWLGVRSNKLPETFIKELDLIHLAKISNFEITRNGPYVLLPFSTPWISPFIKNFLNLFIPIKLFSSISLMTFRPTFSLPEAPSVSIVIPAKDEMGNIEKGISQLVQVLDRYTQIVFIEGHSSDGTWEEIQKIKKKYQDQFQIEAYKQLGKGKADAVRLGLSLCKNEFLIILDADLTVPVKYLPRLIELYKEGHADFLNGSRLLYQMEDHAMPYLNKLGNIFFTKLLSRILRVPLTDTLCGTKAFNQLSYRQIKKWQDSFGQFDPFGDFELLFPAAELAIGILNYPIRYEARTYGKTNINRFSHGLQLLQLCLRAITKLR